VARRRIGEIVAGGKGLSDLGKEVDSALGFSRKRVHRGASPASIEKVAEECARMRKENDWSEAKASHLVALYAWCHEKVYTVAPSELAGLTWMAATSAAAKLVRDEFNGNVEEAVEYVRWTWRREAGREKWRVENDRPGSRIGWRLQFQQRLLVTDYRIDAARAAKRKKL
jgi:hypothetical protein